MSNVHDAASELYAQLRAARPRLERLLQQTDVLNGSEPDLGQTTQKVLAELQSLAPDRPLHWPESTQSGSNSDTRHVLLDFLQVRFFLQLAVQFARAEPEEIDQRAGSSEVITLLRLYRM
jgi:hypothetical protein